MREVERDCTVLSPAASAQGMYSPSRFLNVHLKCADIFISYFNTVGSKEGWTPSTFVSSRTNRHKDDATKAQNRPENYMDEEDLEDAAEAQKLQTSHAFAGLGSTEDGESQAAGLSGLFTPTGDTMGLRLLRRMGWKDGQGIGPKVRRGARLDVAKGGDDKTFLFAPDNAAMIRFVRKTDRKGLGHSGEQKLSGTGRKEDTQSDEEDEEDAEAQTRLSLFSKPKKKPGKRGAIGVGILNDDGSDEDPYEIGPKIKYNRTIGGDKKKKAKKTALNPALKKAPVFVSKLARGGSNSRRCHDGRLPLDGFVLAQVTEDFANLFSQYAPPSVPQGWKSAKGKTENGAQSNFVSAADAAKASTLDPRSRAALLGEQALPGKSVFDFLSGSARDQLAAGSGRQNLPPAKGEVPVGYELSEEDRKAAFLERVPTLDRQTAIAALARGSGGPYADDEVKRSRYRGYLEHFANPARPLPEKSEGIRDDEYIKEMTEFANCAKIFKPMTGFMASRFTTGKKTTVIPGSDGATSDSELVSKSEPKVADPAEEAAKMGMFGKMTRSTAEFYPTRLLCKRFNVRPPAHSQGDDAGGKANEAGRGEGSRHAEQAQMQLPVREETKLLAARPTEETLAEVVDPEQNEAVEGTAAHAEVLRAIFGDSDSE